MDKDYLIEKWLNNELNDAEKEAFKQLDDYQLHIDILEGAKEFQASNFSKIDDFNTFNERYQAQNVPVKKLNWIHPLLRFASILVIAFGVYFTFFYNNLTHVQTLASEKVIIELPDASQVTLNALSNIEFSKRKWDDNRRLSLEGEAFFKVAKGKQFDVVTSDGLVSVVGTEFNVKQRENYFEVQCFEGVVRVTSDTIIRQLIAGDTYKILNGNFTQGKTTSSQPQWTNNKSSFESIPFMEVISELQRQFDIEVSFNNVDVNRLFTGGFSHENLDNALISITQPLNLTYKLNSSNHVVIYGQNK